MANGFQAWPGSAKVMASVLAGLLLILGGTFSNHLFSEGHARMVERVGAIQRQDEQMRDSISRLAQEIIDFKQPGERFTLGDGERLERLIDDLEDRLRELEDDH